MKDEVDVESNANISSPPVPNMPNRGKEPSKNRFQLFRRDQCPMTPGNELVELEERRKRMHNQAKAMKLNRLEEIPIAKSRLAVENRPTVEDRPIIENENRPTVENGLTVETRSSVTNVAKEADQSDPNKELRIVLEKCDVPDNASASACADTRADEPVVTQMEVDSAVATSSTSTMAPTTSTSSAER